MNPIKEIAKIAHKVPPECVVDIMQRIEDWLLGGGNVDDPYVWQQLRYAERLVRREPSEA